MELGVWGTMILSVGILVGQSPLRKFLGSKEHLDWLNKVDLNAAEIITAQYYKDTKS